MLLTCAWAGIARTSAKMPQPATMSPWWSRADVTEVPAYNGPPLFTTCNAPSSWCCSSTLAPAYAGTGFSVDDITSYLKCNAPYEILQVKMAIESMLNEGHMYPTIDDAQFTLCR